MPLERLSCEDPEVLEDLSDFSDEERADFTKAEQIIKKSEGLHPFCRAIKRDVKQNFDSVVLVTGEREGIGKSTFAIQCARIIDGPRFALDRNIIYDPDVEAVQTALKGLPRYTPIVFDEAVKVLFNREWYSKVNIFLNKWYKVSRKLNQISFMCIPDISDVDSKFFQTKVTWWVHVIDRGTAVVRFKDWVADELDKWHLKDNAKVIRRTAGFLKVSQVPLELKMRAYRRTSNFVGEVHFEDLPKDLSDEYKRISEEYSKKFEFFGDGGESKREQVFRSKFDGVIASLVKLGLNTNQISEKTGLTPEEVKSSLRRSDVKVSVEHAELRKREAIAKSPFGSFK